MYSKRTLVRFVMLAIFGPLAMIVTVASVAAQNLPPPGAYQAIPNFTGVGAGLQFRQAINDRFSGAQRVAPAIATVSFANLPAEQDGTILYCQDCKLTSPCVGTGTGAWAQGARGHWSCASGLLEASLNANGNKLTNLANGTVSGDALDFGQSAGSDLSGTLPNPIVQTVLGGRLPLYSTEASASLNDSPLSSFGAATTAIGQPAANMTLNKPSTVVAGNTMIMAYYAQSASAPTPPTGWTLIRSDSCAGGALGSYYKVAGSSEPSSYTWTSTSAYYAAALIDVGATASNPVDTISPIACGGTPTIAGLSTSAQPENVIVIGAGANGNINQVGFSQGALAVLQPASGGVPLSIGYLTSNYSTSPAVALTGSGAAEVAQMIAIKPASTYTGSPVLQGDGYVELTKLHGRLGADSSISHFNINGDFNVKNPIYGAKGDGLTDDTAAIQAALNAACALGAAVGSSETLLFPAGTYATSFPILSNCGTPVLFRGESENTAVIKAVSGALFPIVMHDGKGYLANMITAAGGSLTGTSLASGPGSSLVWGASSQQFYDLEDAANGVGPYSLSGAGAFSIEGFLNYAGGAPGDIYIAQSNGDDLNLPNNASSAMQLFLVPGSPNKIAGCITTSVTGFTCTSAGGSITAGTTYEFEWSYDGSNLRVFEGLPGGTTTLAGSVAATGTIVQKPSEVFALGDGGSGLIMTGENLQTNAHWIGQLDSIRLSTVARHAATYTAPTAKFASDGSTVLLLNNENQKDIFVQASYVGGLGAVGVGPPVWMPLHSNALAGGNTHGGFFNLSMSGGSYSVLAIGALYTTFDHVNAGGAAHYGIKMFNNCYGPRFEHLTVVANPFAESGLTLSDNSGLAQLTWIFQTGSYYGMQMVDAGGTYSMLFLNPGSSQVAGMDIASTDLFHSYSIHELAIDFESGGSQVPVKLWGSGNYQFYGGDFQPGTNNSLVVAPGGVGSSLGLTLFGGNVVTSGTAPLISWKGGNPPATPAMWINPTINGGPLSAYSGGLSDNPAYTQAVGDVTIMPTKTVATLPACNAASKGWSVQIKDCNANCTTYLGTTFTGGGTTRSTVQCNGTAWELH